MPQGGHSNKRQVAGETDEDPDAGFQGPGPRGQATSIGGQERSQAALFRQHQKTTQVIKLIDSVRNREYVWWHR